MEERSQKYNLFQRCFFFFPIHPFLSFSGPDCHSLSPALSIIVRPLWLWISQTVAQWSSCSDGQHVRLVCCNLAADGRQTLQQQRVASVLCNFQDCKNPRLRSEWKKSHKGAERSLLVLQPVMSPHRLACGQSQSSIQNGDKSAFISIKVPSCRIM